MISFEFHSFGGLGLRVLEPEHERGAQSTLSKEPPTRIQRKTSHRLSHRTLITGDVKEERKSKPDQNPYESV